MSQPVGDKSFLKGAWSGSPDQLYNFTPHEIFLERLKLSRQILCGCRLYQVLAFARPTIPKKGWFGSRHLFQNFAPP